MRFVCVSLTDRLGLGKIVDAIFIYIYIYKKKNSRKRGSNRLIFRGKFLESKLDIREISRQIDLVG